MKEQKWVSEEKDKQKAVRRYVDIDKHDHSFISKARLIHFQAPHIQTTYSTVSSIQTLDFRFHKFFFPCLKRHLELNPVVGKRRGHFWPVLSFSFHGFNPKKNPALSTSLFLVYLQAVIYLTIVLFFLSQVFV